MHGTGGRWTDLEEESGAAKKLVAPGLSVIELLCFAVMTGLLFYLARELNNRGAGPILFQRLPPERHVFASLGLAIGAYLAALSGTAVPKMARVAGAMLAGMVSVAMLYVLLFLGANLYLTGAGIALVAGAALCSRTNTPRDQGYPAAMVAASVIMIAFVVTAHATR